jgi:hypothetical protein
MSAMTGAPDKPLLLGGVGCRAMTSISRDGLPGNPGLGFLGQGVGDF